jgi:integrase
MADLICYIISILHNDILRHITVSSVDSVSFRLRLVSSVGNLALKGLVAKMVKAGLSPKTINTYSQVVKSVVASAVNEEGEQLYPRRWNHEFCDMPVVDKRKQKTPCPTSEVMTGIIATTKGYKQMYLAFEGGGGFRAGEAIGIEIDKHISADFRTIKVRQKVRRGKLEHFLKTDAGRRDVDLCSALAEMLKAYVGGRTAGFLFQNKNGNFPSQTNLLRRGLHPALKKPGQPKAGLHSLRRFRLTWLRKNRVPGDLERFWMGHENETVGDDYSKLKDDVAFRLEQAEKVGLGFEIPKTTDVVRIVRKNEVAVETESAAQGYESRGEKWSGRKDLNLRPPGPEPGALARLRYAPTVKLRLRNPARARNLD